MVAADPKKKPLSIAVDEVYHGKVKTSEQTRINRPEYIAVSEKNGGWSF